MIYQAQYKDGLQRYLEENSIAHNLDLTYIKNQDDLYYVEAVLVSLGINKNDDVFIKEEAWNARHTPIHKQFNLKHKEGDIIGHIVSSYVVSDGKIIPDNIPLEDVPDNFDIIVGSVIYKKFKDENLQTRANSLIEEIKDGKWFVSMECWHKNFDYMLISPNGEKKIIAKNEKTSFLTKHLRRYKGSGSFEGHKIARVLRGFYFSGKGLVENPANPKSVFVSHAEENTMSFTEAQYKELADKLALTEKQLKELSDKSSASELSDLKAKLDTVENQIKTVSEDLTKSNERVKALEGELSVAQEVIKNKTESITSLEAAKAELDKKVADQAVALQVIEQEKVKASRLAKLVKVNISDDKAKNLVDQFITVAEDQFDLIVNSFPVKEVTEVPVNKTEANLDDLEEEEDLKLAIANTDQAKELRVATSEWFKQSFNRRVKNGS